MINSQFENTYSKERFWQKLGHHAKAAGRTTLEKALCLYYAAQSPNTPKWAKRVIYGALGYFIFPVDAIPDFVPLFGYTDDVSVMAAALVTVAFYITPEVKDQARQKLSQWFDGGPRNTYADVERTNS